MKVNYSLDGIAVNPIKRENISIEVNHDQGALIDHPKSHVGIKNLYFAREDVATLMERINSAPGITEGIPFDITISERGKQQIINMYVDAMEGFKRSADGISVSLKMRDSLDSLDDRAEAFTFESLYNETNVTPFKIDGVLYNSYQQFLDLKCIYIPYVISTVPNYRDAFMALFGITYIATELYKVSKHIIQWATPIAGIGVVLGVAQLVLEIAFAVLLLITLVGFLTQLIASLIQPIKYHAGMLISDMLKVTAAKLGLEASSSIWNSAPYNQLAYIPEKYNSPQSSLSVFSLMGISVGGVGSGGYTSPAYAPGTTHDSETENIQHGYLNGTGADFLRMAKLLSNGKLITPDNSSQLILERRDYYPPGNLFQLQNIRQDWNGFNTDEMSANILISFVADLNDKNSIDHIDASGNAFYKGTIFQATHQQIMTKNKSLVCLKGVREIHLGVARGVAKDTLTVIERAVLDLEIVWAVIKNIAIAIINTVIAAVNVLIVALNIFITLWNLIIDVLHLITDVLNVIIDVVNTLPFVSIPNITVFDNGAGHIGYISYIGYVSFISLPTSEFNSRFNCLLLENDNMSVPKVVMVDTARTEYVNSRIAYLHTNNASVVNAENMWNKFYSVDAFVGSVNNRFTKITPALDYDSNVNKTTLSLADFKNLVSNPKFLDNYGEEVIAESINWFPERNGAADFSFRKKGWLRSPQHSSAIKRAQEIEINLQIKTSVPNGQ